MQMGTEDVGFEQGTWQERGGAWESPTLATGPEGTCVRCGPPSSCDGHTAESAHGGIFCLTEAATWWAVCWGCHLPWPWGQAALDGQTTLQSHLSEEPECILISQSDADHPTP